MTPQQELAVKQARELSKAFLLTDLPTFARPSNARDVRAQIRALDMIADASRRNILDVLGRLAPTFVRTHAQRDPVKNLNIKGMPVEKAVGLSFLTFRLGANAAIQQGIVTDPAPFFAPVVLKVNRSLPVIAYMVLMTALNEARVQTLKDAGATKWRMSGGELDGQDFDIDYPPPPYRPNSRAYPTGVPTAVA